MELLALNALKFSLTVSTIKNFLTRFLLIAELSDSRAMHLANYLAEMVLPVYSIQQKYRPSQIAAAIVCLCKGTLVPYLTVWSSVFEMYCQCNRVDLRSCVQEIYQVHETISNAPTGRFTSAREKYKQQKYDSVSTIPLSPTILAI